MNSLSRVFTIFSTLLMLCANADATYNVPPKMAWWYDARVGMFIHFGSYSRYGRGEWAFSNEGWSKTNYQTQISTGFNPTNFSASAIVSAAKAAGMKYIVITAKHHEGFAMWHSQVPGFTDTTGTKWYNLYDYAGFHRDLLQELKTECDAQGIKFCLYYSILDWDHPSQTIRTNQPVFSTMSSFTARSNYIADMKAQLAELITNYNPAVLWFDGDWCGNPASPTLTDWWVQSDATNLYSYLLSLKPDLIINERVKRGLGLGDFECPEQEVPAAALLRPWETCATMNGAWGYDTNKETSYRSTTDFVRELVQVVSRDGNYLLNIGPKGDGSMTSGSTNILAGLAAWMNVYGDSVHGTTGSPFGVNEPNWGYYTKRAGKLYAHVLSWPGSQLQVPALTNAINRVYFLNDTNTSLAYSIDGVGINIALPPSAPNAMDSVVVIEVNGIPAGANLLVNGDFSSGNAPGGFDVSTNDCPGWRNAGSTYADTGTAGLAWCQGGDSGGYQITGYQLKAGDRLNLTWNANLSWSTPVQTVRLLAASTTNASYASATSLAFTNNSLAGNWVQYAINYTAQPADTGKYAGVFFANTGASGTYAQFDNFTLKVTPQATAVVTQFVAGADMSLLAFYESNGIAYKENGVTQDALALLKSKGINCVRLRLFASSPAQALADPYNYINNTNYTIPLAVRVKNAGLKLLLDFHYSDTWADPNNQKTPAAWTNLNFTQLVVQMRSYNSNCLAAFRDAGAAPDFVQIGNEITAGLVWTNGQLYDGFDTTLQWPKVGQLLAAAAQGVKDGGGANPPQIIVHIDRGGDWAGTKYFFDNLIYAQQVPFDIIGESYYPFWHGSLNDLSNCLSNAALTYGKPVMVCETAFPWTNSVWTTNMYGFAPTIDGQKQYVAALAQVVKSVPNHLGAGVFWWGTEYQKVNGVNGAGFETTSLFDSQGNLVPAAAAFGQLVAPVLLEASVHNSQMQIAWPLSGSGMQMTSTTSLAPGSVWMTVTNSVQNTGGTFYVTVPATGVSSFYRLQGN